MGHHTVVTIYVACEFQFELDLEFAWNMLFEDARLHNVGILTIDIFIAIYINIYIYTLRTCCQTNLELICKYVTTYFYSRLNQLSSQMCSNFRDMFILLVNRIIPPLFFMSFIMCISSKLAIIFYYYVILYSFLRKNKRLHLDDNKKCFSLIFRITMLWLQISIIVCEAFTHKEANE